MSRKQWGSVLAVLGVAAVLVVLPAPIQAASAADEESGVGYELAGVASILGSMVYLPFKAVILCPVAALGAGATWAVTGGETARAERVLRIGCAGDYLVGRRMLTGTREFENPDPPAVQAGR
ncbi:MAG: hypothetical protein WC713_12305 [Candidatus Methylomirabilota bacterium]